MNILRVAPAVLLIAFGSSVAAEADVAFEALMREVWEWRLAADPVFASRLGDGRYDREWPDLSLESVALRQQQAREFLRRLYAIDRTGLEEHNVLNYELFLRDLKQDVDEFQFRGHLMPFSQQGGIQNLDSLTDYLRFETVGDYEEWLSRLDKLDEYVLQTIALAERGRREGLTSPAVLMERLPEQIHAQVVEEPDESPYFALFENLPPGLPAAERERLRKEARAVIAGTVLPAYRELARYFEQRYLPASRDSIGLSALPDGSAWYEFLARRFTTTDMTPDQIHELGLKEVRRLRDAMQAIITELEFDGTFADFLEYLRTDAQFYYSDSAALYEAYLAASKRIDPELVKLFGTLPRMPYGVKPIPDSIAPDTTTAYYSPPAADGSRAGIYWVNLYRPDVRPKYEVEVLTVHEAVPGHHLQLALQQELAGIPRFRRHSGFTAFIEGWGLYSESLGYELGLYKDPYSRFGQLTYEMWRAVRLVVDTGMHYKGWTRQQAIDFFRDNAAKTEHDIVNEIDRYIGNPGQALAYKVGELTIKAIRSSAENQLGERFDIRAFHDELLGAGALPLDLLEDRMQAWVASQR